MTQQSNRRAEASSMSGGAQFMFVCIGLLVVVGGAIYSGMHLGHQLTGSGVTVPKNPWEVLFGVLSGDVAWPGVLGTVIAVAVGLLITLLVASPWLLGWYFRRGRSRVDAAATYMGHGKAVEGVSLKAVTATAQRLGVTGSPGLKVGDLVFDGKPVYGSYEDTHIDIWGPRTGKTTSRAVPSILDAPGGVLVTSNKRDVVDATRDPRAERGAVWVFDPQGVAEEQPTWWWNPLSYVTDEVRAKKLAGHFVMGSRETGSKGDAYFDATGQDLLAALLLAAASADRPITDVYRWLTQPTNPEAAAILEDHGHTLIADQVRGVIAFSDKQRGGIYGTAMQAAACLTNRQVAAWVNPQGEHDTREQFDPAAFVRSEATLYSLSLEGAGTAGPLVTALTVAVTEAAEELAKQSPGGRLEKPLVCVLDEAANVCRWAQLPSLYSHYGSRGIILMTILQSWSQGVDVWGESGMHKLWSASNIAVYGGGVREEKFLEMLSKLIGDRDRRTTSTSTGRGQRSVSQQLRRERILEASELAELPKGRAIVLASGSRSMLVRTKPWMTGPHADKVRASIKRHDPLGTATIAEAEDELRAVQADEKQRKGRGWEALNRA